LGSKLNISDFNIYSSTTQRIISNNYNNFIIYTANTLNVIDGKLDKTGGIVTGDLTVLGNMVFNGTATTINTQNLLVYDPIIGLALSQSGSTFPTLDAGFIIDRGISGNTGLIWIETNKQFELGYTTGSSLNTNVRINEYGGLKVGNLYTTNNVGVGTSTPLANLDIYSNTGNSSFRLAGNAGVFASLYRYSNNVTRSRYELYKARGTDLSPLSIQTNDEIGSIDFHGYDGTAFQRNAIVLVQASSVSSNTITSRYSIGLGSTAANNVYFFSLNSTGAVVGDNSQSISPLAKLHVRGSSSASSTTALRIENSNFNSSLVVRDDGNIGVGISNPSAQLHISGTSLSNPLLINTSGGTTGLVVNNSGNVGIGTPSPTVRLDVSGSSQFTAISSTWSIIPSANYASIGGSSQGASGAFIINPQTDFSQSYNGTTIPIGATIGAFGGGQYVNIGSFNSAGGGVRYFSSLNGAVHSHTWYHNKINQLMSLSYRGNLEIGSSTVDVNLARLYVRGVGVTSSTTGFRVDDSNGIHSLIIRDNRRIGVGIDNPSAQFHISGLTTTDNLLLVNTSGGTTGLVVNNNGYVGINTTGSTSPAGVNFFLDVNGNARVSTLYFTNGNSGTISHTGTGLILTPGPSSAGVLEFAASGGRTIRVTGTAPGTVGLSVFNFLYNYTTSGAGQNFNSFNIAPTINTTGSYSGTIRGIYYNPTLTSTVGLTHRAIETTSGDILFQSGSTPILLVSQTGTSVGIGVSSVTPSAKLEVNSTIQGFLPPRMTGAQAEAIQSPAEGLLIYATDGSGVTITTKGWWGFEGLTWTKLN
jgi:hypothetical protein